MTGKNNFKNKKARPTMRRGSMLIAVLLIVVMISVIIFSLIQRSIRGFGITSASKQAYSSYQASDSGAEYILNELRKVDNDTRGSLDVQRGEIPQNMSATAFCAVPGVRCFRDVNGISPILGTDMVSSILSVKAEGTYEDSRKTVAVSIPTRIVNPTSNLKAEKCDVGIVGCHPNRCDVKVSWSNGFSQNVSGFEVRRSIDSSLTTFRSDYGWRIAKGTTIYQGGNPFYNLPRDYFIVENGDAKISNQIGTKYYFSIKAKNKNNFALDSLYKGVVFVASMEENSCVDTAGTGLVFEGCVSPTAKPDGAIFAQVSYSCCNGTECYQCPVGKHKVGNSCQ